MTWGALVFKVGYHPRLKELGLFFRTRRCTCIHRLGVQNHAKLKEKKKKKKKKGGVFVIFYKFRKGHDGKIKGGKIMQKRVIRVCFHTWKIRALIG